GCVEDQGSKTALAIVAVVKHLRPGGHQAHIRAIDADARVVCETIRVVTEANLAVRGMKAAVRGGHFDFPVAFERRGGDDVEDAVGAVPVLAGFPAALDFHNVDILGVKLRANVRSNVGVGYGYAVDQPGNLMAAANVQLVMDHVSARRVSRDELETVRPRSTGRGLNL